MALRLTVLGTGYLGATHAACMARLGYDVLGMDIDADTVAALAAGEPTMYEPGLEELLKAGLASGRLRFTTSYQEAAEFADLHFVCVGTPQKLGEYAADVSALDALVDGLAPHLRAPAVVVGKSNRAHRHGGTDRAEVAERGPGRRRGRARLEPGVPERGLRAP